MSFQIEERITDEKIIKIGQILKCLKMSNISLHFLVQNGLHQRLDCRGTKNAVFIAISCVTLLFTFVCEAFTNYF